MSTGGNIPLLGSRTSKSSELRAGIVGIVFPSWVTESDNNGGLLLHPTPVSHIFYLEIAL